MSAEASISYTALILANLEVELFSDNLLVLTSVANVKVDFASTHNESTKCK